MKVIADTMQAGRQGIHYNWMRLHIVSNVRRPFQLHASTHERAHTHTSISLQEVNNSCHDYVWYMDVSHSCVTSSIRQDGGPLTAFWNRLQMSLAAITCPTVIYARNFALFCPFSAHSIPFNESEFLCRLPSPSPIAWHTVSSML
jgi:hypothetical protein